MDINNSVALYILMYADLPDMTGGKAAAQAAHASTMCTLIGEKTIRCYYDSVLLPKINYDLLTKDKNLYTSWKTSTLQGFGTTLVFRSGTDEQGLCMPVEIFTSQHKTLWGVVNDPTYPYRDVDKTIKTMNVNTCAWFLADRSNPDHKATLDSIHNEYPFVLF